MTYNESALIAVIDREGSEVMTLLSIQDGAPDQAIGRELAWFLSRCQLVEEVSERDIETHRKGQFFVSVGMHDLATDLVTVLNGRKPYGRDFRPRLGGLYARPGYFRGFDEVWLYEITAKSREIYLEVKLLNERVFNGRLRKFNPESIAWEKHRRERLARHYGWPNPPSRRSDRDDASSDCRPYGDTARESNILDFYASRRA